MKPTYILVLHKLVTCDPPRGKDVWSIKLLTQELKKEHAALLWTDRIVYGALEVAKKHGLISYADGNWSVYGANTYLFFRNRIIRPYDGLISEIVAVTKECYDEKDVLQKLFGIGLGAQLSTDRIAEIMKDNE